MPRGWGGGGDAPPSVGHGRSLGFGDHVTYKNKANQAATSAGELGKRKSSKAGGGAGRLNCASGWGQGGRSLPGGHRLGQLLPPQGCVPFWPGQLGLSLGWWGARGVVVSSLPGDTCPCSSCSPLPPQGPAARLPLEQSSGWKSGPGQPGRPTPRCACGACDTKSPQAGPGPHPAPHPPLTCAIAALLVFL